MPRSFFEAYNLGCCACAHKEKVNNKKKRIDFISASYNFKCNVSKITKSQSANRENKNFNI